MPASSKIDATELYRLLVETVEDYAIFALDPEGYVLSWNPGAERLKGYKADEIIGRHFSIFYPASDLAVDKPAYELKVAEAVGRFEDEGWRLKKDGSQFWANVIITAIKDSSGSLIGFAKVTRDLTSRREAETQARKLAAESAARAATEEKNRELEHLTQQLEEQAVELEAQAEESQSLVEELEYSTEELRTTLADAEGARENASRAEQLERAARARAELLQQLTTELSIAASIDDVANAAISRVAEAFPDVAGIVIATRNDENAEVELLRASDMSPEVFEQWRHTPIDTSAPLPDVVRSGEPLFLESPRDWEKRYPHLVTLLGETGHRAQMVLPLMVAARCIGAMGVAFRKERDFPTVERDFALSVAAQCANALERARLFDAERLARAAAENANMAKGEFLAKMSHELRTPLNAIGGHVELLSMEIHGPVSSQQADALTRIKRAQLHLLGVINDLLNFARLERGSLQYHLEPVIVQDVVADLQPMIEPQVDAKHLSYEVKLPSEPVTVIADHDKLVQILLNLLSNSVKFTAPDGSITLDLAQEGEEAEKIEYVFLRLTDTGVGIPAEKLETIFDPFVQLSTGRSSRRDGTGLGLTISRDLARGMGGDLYVRSTVGESTSFILRLPRQLRQTK